MFSGILNAVLFGDSGSSRLTPKTFNEKYVIDDLYLVDALYILFSSLGDAFFCCKISGSCMSSIRESDSLLDRILDSWLEIAGKLAEIFDLGHFNNAEDAGEDDGGDGAPLDIRRSSTPMLFSLDAFIYRRKLSLLNMVGR